MKRQFLILFFFFLIINSVFSQSPFEVSWKKELPYIGVGVGTLITGKFLIKGTPFFTIDELNTLNSNNVNRYDRAAINNFSQGADRLSDVFVYSAHATPYLFLLGNKSRDNFGHIMVMYGEAASINLGLTLMTKSLFNRPRPYSFNKNVTDEFKLSRKSKTSFLSGHTSMTAVNTFFGAKVFSQLYPDSKWKPVIWTLAATIPATTGYLRVKAGRHYPTDVLAGYAVGATIGFLVPHLHQNKKLAEKGVSINTGINSAYLTWQFSKPRGKEKFIQVF